MNANGREYWPDTPQWFILSGVLKVAKVGASLATYVVSRRLCLPVAN